MSVTLTINGIGYNYPENGDQDWGADATSWASAVTLGMLQKSGGVFQLLAEVDFGSSYGVKSLYIKSRSSNVASAGQIRLANTDVISFRDFANVANLDLGVNVSDQLTFNGGAFLTSGSIVNADISASAAIAWSKMANLTVSRALVSDGSGDVSVSAATATEVGYLSGVTSAIQTQFASYLPLSGGTISSNLIITGDLTVNGTSTTLNTATLDVEDKNIKVNFGGNDASSEGAGLQVVRTVTNGSLIYADAATSKFKIGALAAEIEIADISSSQTLTNKIIDSDNNTITNIVNADIKAGAAIDATKIADGTVTSIEFQYINTVTSNVQTQLDSKQALTTVATPGAYPYTALNATVILVDTASARSIQLPAPSANFICTIKDAVGSAGTNNITVLRNASEQIEGVAASRLLSSDWGAWTFVSNGTNWFMI